MNANVKGRYKRMLKLWTVALAGIILSQAVSVRAATPLTVEDVRRIALEFNRTYLAAHEDVVKAQTEITKARAGALPDITASSHYNRNMKLGSFFLNPEGAETIEFKTGFKNEFGASLSLTQSIWKGGKVFKALQIAKLYKEYARQIEEEVKASVTYNAELLFYRAILEQSNLQVLEKAFEANSYNLEVVEKVILAGNGQRVRGSQGKGGKIESYASDSGGRVEPAHVPKTSKVFSGY